MPRPPYNEERRKAEILGMGRREGACLIWTGVHTWQGYGKASWHGKYKLVHQLAYEWAYGPIPEGLEPDHTCRRRDCFEPKHLEAVTHQENMLRGQTIAAKYATREACGAGHPYTPENTRIRRGVRECLTCCREYTRRRYLRRKNAGLIPRACHQWQRKGEPNPLIDCACGCGQKFTMYGHDRRRRRFIAGHNNRIKLSKAS